MAESSSYPGVQWQAQWIGRPGATMSNWQARVLPAPLLRREFRVDSPVAEAVVHVCGLGYCELHLNGGKVGDRVLDPVVTQYDRRVRYTTYDVTSELHQGANAIAAVLGNGWYNCHTTDVWHFDKASWRDYPKLLLQLEITYADGEREVLVSGSDWRVGESPIRFDGLRNGETYDARREMAGWDRPGFDDSAWARAGVVAGPGGELEPQTAPPCRVVETLTPVDVRVLGPGHAVFDLGQNMAGWARLHARGPAGTEVTLRYAEKLAPDGTVDQGNINSFIKSGDCQTDRYTLKGTEGEEVWEPRFTYHGFQYVEVTGYPGTPTVESLEGRVVQTDFDRVGTLSTSDPELNRLQDCTLWAYRGNFVGIPTDCPHREKNGWTGDAQLAAETGLMNFAAAPAYREWLATLVDTQRPSGQLPGIAPSTGWGYNWGSGPAWDSALFLIPWYVYLYTGDSEPIRACYPAMERYLGFCEAMATDHIVHFGLGDWCHVDNRRMAPAALTSTGYYYCDLRLMERFAVLTGHEADARGYAERAEEVRDAFNLRFYRGNGIYAGGQPTALACAVFQGLVPESEKALVVETLAAAVEGNDCKVDFGILGAKYIPRVLAENGHAGLAFRLLTQPEFPGWIHWIRQGATTLWESWDGGASRNHIMFGDVSAWMYQYLAGIAPDSEAPGFRRVLFHPTPVETLDWVRASFRAPQGTITAGWRRQDDVVRYELEVPDGSRAHVLLPATGRLTRGSEQATPGLHQTPAGFECELGPGTFRFDVTT